jgi:hypothetical protein
LLPGVGSEERRHAVVNVAAGVSGFAGDDDVAAGAFAVGQFHGPGEAGGREEAVAVEELRGTGLEATEVRPGLVSITGGHRV